MFDGKLTIAAWKTKPTWAIVSTNDRMLPPAMEEAAVNVKRMGAVAAVIDEAARMALTKQSDKLAISH
jgi:hypothetical protein